MSCLFMFKSFFLLLLFFLLCSFYTVFALNSQGKALLSFATTLTLPPSIKSSWNSSDSTPCKWEGIACDNKQHVIQIRLNNQGISGHIGPQFTYLKFLQTLDLSVNNISGPIPSKNLTNLQSLSTFSLYNNSLTGEIPISLFQIPTLEAVYLSSNKLVGSIPSNVGNAKNLIALWLYSNKLSGSIPPSIGDCTQLQQLYLNDNELSGVLPESLSKLEFLNELYVENNRLKGQIPLGIGNCKSLKELILSDNHLSGEIPHGLGNCSGLKFFAALHNGLSGQIPSSLGLLTNLSYLYLNENQLSGKIPPEIGKCRSLTVLLLNDNQLEGTIPNEFGMLSNLQTLQLFNNFLTGEIPLGVWKIQSLVNFHVYNNSLVGELPVEMAELRQLQNVSLFGNQFSGIIPQTLGINTSLEQLDLTNNKFSGEIPPHLCFGKQLRILTLGINQLQGSIPSDIGSCPCLKRLILQNNSLTSLPEFESNPNLMYIDVSGNNISGVIPSSLFNCKNLSSVNLSRNNLSGLIPRELRNLAELQLLDLSHNRLKGPLPPQISKCTKLFSLDVGFNMLTGSIPSSLSNLTQLSALILMENHFTGGIPDIWADLEKLLDLQLGGNFLGNVIPASIGQAQSLTYHLNLSDNGLTGHIPFELGRLSSLVRLDVSHNNLTGSLAPVGEINSLLEANVSYNLFAGPIPDSLLKLLSSSPYSFSGNPGLCIPCQPERGLTYGTNIKINPCDHVSGDGKGISRKNIAMIALGASLASVLMLIMLGYVVLRCRRPKKEVEILAHEGTSSLLNKVMQATEHLNERYVIGRGAHGTVYKVSLDQDKLYAVKKLVFAGHKTASKSMVREIQTVGQIKHRNLVRLEDFWLRKDKGLILYNYMENGSLHDVLYETNPPPVLTWDVRYRIAMGTAQGLAYLHYDCSPPIVHRDIKPKNILLDSGMEPHISDFGIAKLMDQSTASVHSTSIMGTIGYMAPETAFATVKSTASDVYSYGVVLLELITRKQAVDTSFPEDMDIVRWVRSMLSNTETIDGIVELSLVEEFVDSVVMDEVTEVLMVALRCTSKDPNERPTMRDVVKQLTDAKSIVTIQHK